MVLNIADFLKIFVTFSTIQLGSAQSLSALFSPIQYQFHFPQIGIEGGPMRGLELIM